MVCAYTPQTESPEVSLWRCRDDQVNFVCIRERLLNEGPNNQPHRFWVLDEACPQAWAKLLELGMQTRAGKPSHLVR